MDSRRKATLQPDTDEKQARTSNSPILSASPIPSTPDSRLAQRAHLSPHLLSSQDIRYLQRTVGNRTVARILQRSSSTSAPPPAPQISSTPGPRVQRFGKKLGRVLTAPIRWLGKKFSGRGKNNKDNSMSDYSMSEESDDETLSTLTSQPSNIQSNMEGVRIKFLAEPMDPKEARETLTAWLEETETALKMDGLDMTTREHLEASQRTIEPMLEMVTDLVNKGQTNREQNFYTAIGERQVWRTVVESKNNPSTQAIAILSGGLKNVTVGYIATAPINLYGAEGERTKGSGTALMLTIIRRAKDAGNSLDSIELMADPDAIDYYLKLGFEGEGRRPVDGTWKMELTPDRFKIAEAFLEKHGIGISAPNILKTRQRIDWDALDDKKSNKNKKRWKN
jgi:GNAT superfamily N-acetyltransferase